MSLRSKVGLSTAIVILFSVIPVEISAAATKTGGPCSVQGVISIAGNKKFTCNKSGSKLIWSKGVPSNARQLSPHEIVINSVLLDWSKWKKKATKNYSPLTAILEPGYEPKWKSSMVKTSNYLISVLVGNNHLLLQEPYAVIGDSEEFIRTSSAPYCSNKIPENLLGIYCGRIQAGYGYFLLGQPESENFASGKLLTPQQTMKIGLYVARDIAIMYELQAQYGNMKYDGAKNQIPAWIRQGFVELLAALALSETSGNGKNYSETLKATQTIDEFPKALCTKTLQDFESKDRNWGTSCISSQNLYATELLVARHGGLEALFKFVEMYGVSDDWTSAFNSAFGISRENFYTEWYDYLKIPLQSRPTLTAPAPAAHY